MGKIETLEILGDEDKFAGLSENELKTNQDALQSQRLELVKKLNQVDEDLKRIGLARFENGKKK